MANLSRYRIITINDLRLIRDVSGTATPQDVSFGNSLEFNTDIEEIVYEGDGQRARKYFQTALDITINADDWDALALETIFGKSAVTTGLPAGVAKRTYWGTDADQAGVVCGIEAQATVEDLATGTNKQVVIGAPVGTLSSPTPPNLANIAKAGMVMQFSAKKTAVDIAGDALGGVPAGGAFWYMDELS